MSRPFQPSPIALALAGLCLSTAALAQQAPDAGRVLQELQVPQQTLPEALKLEIQPPAAPAATPESGAQTELRAVRFQGHTRVSSEQLQAQLAPALGQQHTLAGLRALADQVTVFYRAQGYPFARAYLPEQRMVGGELLIAIVEGQYGRVAATAKDQALAAAAQPFLGALKTGEVIANDRLERTVLLLSDLPGVSVTPVMRPGGSVGSGDLEVAVQTTPALQGRLMLDNMGSRYSGQHRLSAAGQWDSPFTLGDRLSATLMATDEDLYFGQLAYSRPLGHGGWRGEVGYALSDYSLGGEFASLQATGQARVAHVGLSYPLLRSNQRNISLSGQLQHKDMRDTYRANDTFNRKSSEVLPLALQFDSRDAWLGGGISHGSLTWTQGRLSLKTEAQRNTDSSSARAEGSFRKLNADVTRLQMLPGGLLLSARVAAQWAGNNLDSSEDFVLGGARGVRAYPSGEGAGDEGVLAQIEVRVGQGRWVPYVFWDAGRSRLNHRPWDTGDNHRSLTGGGLGLRGLEGSWTLDASIAWRAHGGPATADTQQRDPRVLVSVGHQF